MFKRLYLLLGFVLLLGGSLTLSAQDKGAIRDPTAEARLKLARQGYDLVNQRYTHTVSEQALAEFPVWSLRILDAQSDVSGNALVASREHLGRMKEYAKLVAQRYQAGQGLHSAAIDGEYRVLEAESMVAKAQAR